MKWKNIIPQTIHKSRSWLLLLLAVQRTQTASGNLDNLETNTRNIADGVTTTTETGNQHFVVFINEIQTTIAWYERCDFFSILDELDTATFANGRVGLLGLDSDFLNHDSFRVTTTSERVAFVFGSQIRFLVIFVCPQLRSTANHKLTGASDT